VGEQQNSCNIILIKEKYLASIIKNIIFSEDAKKLLMTIIEQNYKSISAFLFTILSSNMLSYYTNINNAKKLDFIDLTRIRNKFKNVGINESDRCILVADIYDILYNRNCRQYDIYSKFTGTFYELIDGDISFFTTGYDVDHLLIDNVSELVHILLDVIESLIIDYSFIHEESELSFMVAVIKGDLLLNFN